MTESTEGTVDGLTAAPSGLPQLQTRLGIALVVAWPGSSELDETRLALCERRTRERVVAAGGIVVGPLLTERVAWFPAHAASAALDAALDLVALSGAAVGLGLGSTTWCVGPAGEVLACAGPALDGALARARAAAVGQVLAEPGLTAHDAGRLLLETLPAGVLVRGLKPPSMHLVPPMIAGHEVPFVARDAELAAIASALAHVETTRQPHWVVISGPAGAGKSALVAEWARRALADRRVQLELGVETEPAAPYASFAALIRARAKARVEDDVEALVRRFERALEGSEAHSRTLAALCSAESTALASRGHLLEALAAWFSAIARRSTTLLWLDAGVALSRATVALLSHLVAHVTDAALLIVTTSRESPDATCPNETAAVTRLVLGALDLAATERVASAWLQPVAPPPRRLGAELATRAAGLPGAVGAMVTALVDTGAIDVSVRPWRVANSRAWRQQLASPADRWALLRLESVPPVHRDLVAAAAVARVALDGSLLCALVPGATLADLAELLGRGLLERVDGERLRVEPALGHGLREYLPSRQRGELARRLADIHDSRADQAHLPADVWREAGRPARALAELRRAAQQAMRLRAPADAAAALEEALELVGPEDLESRLALLADLAEQRVLAAQLGEALAIAVPERALPDARVARIHLWRGWAFEHRGQLDAALASFERARDAAPFTDALLHAATTTGAAAVLVKLGRAEEALDRLDAVVIAGDSAAKHRARSNAERVRGHAELRSGRLPSARAAYQRAHEAALLAVATEETVDALNALGACDFFSGDLAGAHDVFTHALDLAARWDLVHVEGYLVTNLAEVALARGDARTAEDLARRALALHQSLANQEGVAESERLLAASQRPP